MSSIQAIASIALDNWLIIAVACASALLVLISHRGPHQRSSDQSNADFPTVLHTHASHRSLSLRKGHGRRIAKLGHSNPIRHLPNTSRRPQPEHTWTTANVMRVLCSIVILAAAIYIIIFDREANDDRQKWAFGAVGLIFGHWTKG